MALCATCARGTCAILQHVIFVHVLVRTYVITSPVCLVCVTTKVLLGERSAAATTSCASAGRESGAWPSAVRGTLRRPLPARVLPRHVCTYGSYACVYVCVWLGRRFFLPRLL